MKTKSSSSSNLQPKPPVVVILGHVDHGKTTLLDTIRKTNIVSKEAGGITQSIGTYQFKVKNQSAESADKLQTITFIDTPGHQAFTQMRSRGAKVADLAVLVVAAQEGIMPQTKESIRYIKESKLPFLVAINKIDLPGASIEKIHSQLAENDILVEGYGGQVVALPVSAKTGQGIDKLLEMITLLAEMEELKADPAGPFSGVVIESKLDQRRGSLTTILVQNGTLAVGNEIIIEKVAGKVRAIFDEDGNQIKKAGPGVPVAILGLKQVAPAGAKVIKMESAFIPPTRSVSSVAKKPSQEHIAADNTEKEKEKLKIILKADTFGSLEAIINSFSDDVFLIHSGIGNITQNDIELANAGGSQIYAFSVDIPTDIKKLAQIEKVKIHQYKIIYELLQDIEKQILKILEPTIDEEILGQAKIVAEFEIDKVKIAGAKVTEGKILKSEKIHLKREEKIISDAKITSLRHEKEKIAEAKLGQEFGAVFSPSLDFKIGDVIISYKKP